VAQNTSNKNFKMTNEQFKKRIAELQVVHLNNSAFVEEWKVHLEKKDGVKRKGFASMNKDNLRQVAARGGQKRKQMIKDGTAPSYAEIGKLGGLKSRKIKILKK
jgi:hypothetical protein